MQQDRIDKLSFVLNNRQPDLGVVLENVNDPHNIFAVARTCDAVGVQDIFILQTEIPPHKKYGKGSSASASKWVTIHRFDNAETCFAEVRKRYEKVYAAYLEKDAPTIYQTDFTKSIALVFGNEQWGITQQTLPFCDEKFIIPQVGMVPSLNISVACAVTLYEAFRQRQMNDFYGTSRLDKIRYEELAVEWKLKRTID
jgi:tRNA (guanosine-2'-O-)-methyltransferase